MKRLQLFLWVIASCLMMTLPAQVWADEQGTAQDSAGVKTLPYPLATEAVPASAMEYDSVAQCFVVRDTIMQARTRSASGVTVVTRSATTYTEAGVVYGYFGNQLSSDNMDEMKKWLNPWTAEIKNLDIDGVLSPAEGKETWYMQIVGVDNNKLVSNGGELRIYNDIGTTWNYKTIAIDSMALRGNENIKRVLFEDCASASENANTWLKMVIHNGAFQGCKNLKELYMYYYVTEGSNHEEILLPSDVYIGSNVFDGCHEDFRIVVDEQVYNMYLSDPNWSQYADRIVPAQIKTSVKEEKGVTYSYYGAQLSSRNIDNMMQLLEPWHAEFRKLDVEDILSPAEGKETWYLQIVGVNNNVIDAANGEFRIYNDIGTTWNYKTIAIDSTALRGNEHIKKVVFEDCASASENAGTKLKMVIHNGAFKDCKNLREFNMFYYATNGTNRFEMLLPTDVYIGSNVFDGCHEDFRIVVAPQVLEMFLYDSNWSRYADKIVAADYLPTTHKPIIHEGVTYDYAANTLNTLPTSELTRLQSSWWNAAIIGVEIAIAVATYGSGNAAYLSVKASQDAAQAQAKMLYQFALNEVATKYAAATAAEKKLLMYSLNAASEHALSLGVSSRIALSKVAAYPLMTAKVSAASVAGINAMGYMAQTIGNKLRRDPTWVLTGQWLLTENKHTIYHMYVKDVENKESIILYNDMGSVYNYKTVAIGAKAFHNKDSIKTVKFKDRWEGEMYAPLNIVIPDSAFKGCTGLECLDLIMRSGYTSRDVALGPENLILCGEDLFPGCDMKKLKIRIGREKYDEFVENSVWKKYKDNFVVVDVEEVVDYTECGAKYSYTLEQNSRKKETYLNEHNIEHVHVIGEDTAYMKEHQGEIGLFNDAGAYNNYKLDYVKKKAFYGSQALKGISMFDLKGVAGLGDSYTELELSLQDSAFANCPNLEFINMLYFRTDGNNSVEPMAPSRVSLGKDVFANSPKFKVKMVTTAVDEFKADTMWAKYEKQFHPSFIISDDKILTDILDDCGLKYWSTIWEEKFDVYDAMMLTSPTVLDKKFQGVELAAFREFKAFECINLDYVGDSWFKDCAKLQVIELPSTLTRIGKQAFYNCALLDDVVIPTGVTQISDEAFRKCAALRNITFLSNQPATLGDSVFADMPSDYVIYVPTAAVDAYKTAWPQYEEHIQTLSKKHTGILEVTLTEPGTLAKKLGLTITDEDPLTIEGNYHKYDSLRISGPINGTDVGVIRFMGGRDVDNCNVTRARNLKYLDLYDANIIKGGADYNQDGSNNRITEDNCVDTYMFWQLDVLETLILPKTATQIKDYAFNHCNALSRLVVGDSTQSIGKKVTHNSPNLREVILLCDEAPATNTNAWSEDNHVEVFYTPNSCRAQLSGSRVYYTRGDSIGSPFEDDALLHALAEKRVYTIDDLSTLKSVDNLINGNTKVKRFNELLYAMEVKTLGDNSLSGCSSLEEVILPYYVKSISAGACRGCTSLSSIKVPCDTVPTLAHDAFKDLPEDFVIYVKPEMVDAYRKSWTQYADHIQGLLQKRGALKVVTVTEPGTLGEAMGFSVNMDEPDNVGRIGGDIISINALKVVGPINGKDIAVLRMLGGREEEDGDVVTLARMNYLDLYDATICTDENNIKFNRDGKNDFVKKDNEVPGFMFWKLDRLETVILPKNVTRIDDEAFYDNLSIQTIVVGDSTKTVGNDAFGKCPNLKNIVFLCEEKPVLDGDAFSDPISDQPYQVENMYVPVSLYNEYISDAEYTSHTKGVYSKYMEDALFRAYGSHAVMSNDQLQNVTNVDGWFDQHNGVKDLTSLGKSAVDSLKTTTLAPLNDLQKITLPATLSTVEDNAFAANTQLQWIDFSQCTNKDVLTKSNIAKMGINPHTLVYAPDSSAIREVANVVYGSKDSLRCDLLAISDSAGFTVPRTFKAASVSYDRQLIAGEKTTLCLPFGMKVPAGAKAYKIMGDIDEALYISSVDSMEANKPYVFEANENMTISSNVETMVAVTPNRMPEVSTGSYVVSGTLTAVSEAEAMKQRMYILDDNSYWNIFNSATEGRQALLPYRAYVQAIEGGMPQSVLMCEAIDEMDIVDGSCTEFVNTKEKFVGTLTYSRTINNTWNALYLPFQLELTEDILANYDVAYINNVHSYDANEDDMLDAWNVEIVKIMRKTKLKANHPYVIRPKNNDATHLNIVQHNTILHCTTADKQKTVAGSSDYLQYAIKGVYAKTQSADLDNGNYVYAINIYGEWQKMALTTSLIPFRIYLTLKNSDGSPLGANAMAAKPLQMRIVGEETENGTTAIHDVTVEDMGVDTIYDLQGRRVRNPQKGSIYIVNGKKILF